MNNPVGRIIGRDPGANTGVAVIEISLKTLAVLNVYTEIYYVADTPDNTISSQCTQLAKLRKYVNSMVKAYCPFIFAYENAFVNIRFPAAAMKLSQYITTVLLAVSSANPNCHLRNYQPKYIKSIFGKSGTSVKEDMTSALLANNELAPYYRKNITEHEVDAIAIAYTALAEIRENGLLSLA